MNPNEKDFSVLSPTKQIDRIYADMAQRDRTYHMPSNHDHPYGEIYYLAGGSCRFFIGGRFLDVHGGDLLIIPARTLHYARYLFGPCTRYDVFFRMEEPDGEVRAQLDQQGLSLGTWHLVSIPEFYQEPLCRFLDWMIRESAVNDGRTRLLLRYRLQELLLLIGRNGIPADAAPALIHTTDRAIVRAAEYMRDHLQEPLRAEEIAGAAGFSPDYLSRKFRQATGMSPREYLTYLRLRQAALELKETSDSITEIAQRCGFSDGNYFKDCFRRHFGCSPRAYRE